MPVSKTPERFRRFARLKLLPLLAAASLLAAVPLPALADASTLRIATRDIGATQSLTIVLNKSIIVDLPVDVKEVIVSQPEIISAIVRTKQRVILQGLGSGDTNIFFLDASGRTISVLDVRVVKEISQVGGALEAALLRMIPDSDIDVESVTLSGDVNRVVLAGTVRSEDDFKRAGMIATQFAGSPENVANLITIGGSQQVMLHVTVAEVSRDTIKQLGINLSGSASIGAVGVGFNSGQTALANGISTSVTGSNFSLTAQLRALETRGAVKTLAEPTLTAVSGQPAEFLAGGQVPVLTAVKDGERTFTLKDIGVKLNFTPTIRSNGVIGLTVDTDVTEVSETGFDTGSGVIPGFNTRRAKTSVEMRAGETLAIAGIIQDKMRQNISGIPGLGHIPILGALFRSREFQRSQTELVILVTPYLARPTTEAMPLPTDQTTTATDAEAIFLGLMEKNYSVGVGPDGMRGSLKGSIGFVLD